MRHGGSFVLFRRVHATVNSIEAGTRLEKTLIPRLSQASLSLAAKPDIKRGARRRRGPRQLYFQSLILRGSRQRHRNSDYRISGPGIPPRFFDQLQVPSGEASDV